MRASFDFGEPYSFSSSNNIAVVFIIFSPRSLIIRNYLVKIKRFSKRQCENSLFILRVFLGCYTSERVLFAKR